MKSNIEIIEIGKQVIRHEANAIKLLEQCIDNDFAKAVEVIYNSKGRVIITGIGKSANISQKIVATLNSTGTPAVFMHAADAIHGDLGIVQENDVVVCISKSGNTPEIKVLLPLIKMRDNKLIAIVSNTDSFLAKQSDFVLKAHIEDEACPNNLAPTSSTTAQLVMGDALAIALLDYRKFSSEDFAKHHPGGSLGKKLYLRVSDLFSENEKPYVYEEDSIEKVILEITTKRLGATAVVSQSNAILGVITDGDLRRMLYSGKESKGLIAKDVMSINPKVIKANELAAKAFNLMEKNSITQLIVVSGEGYVGMIHIHDILKEGIV